jgi:hypothetical protein
MPPSRHVRRALLAALAAQLLAVPSPALSAGGPPAGRSAAGNHVSNIGSGPVASVRLIVRTGERAPDGGIFTELADPALNDRGDLAFGAETDRRRAAQGLYFRHDGHLSVLATVGRRVSTGGDFSTLSDVVLNNRGTIIFLGRTTDRTARVVLYAVREGHIMPVVVTGQPAPSGGVFTDFANPTINDNGVIAFVGRTNGAGTEGIYTNVAGTTTVAVMGGWPAPTGGLFMFFLDGSPALNNRDQIAFDAATTDHATQGLYVLSHGRIAPVVTTDDAAPVGSPFTEFGFVNLSDAGTVGFDGRTAQNAVREALYATGRETLVTLARQGEIVDGAPLDTFVNVYMNDAEDMVFEPGIVRFPDVYPHTIYLARRSGVTTLVHEGQAAPGGGRFAAFSQPILNNHHQVAFVAETDDGHHGIYLLTLR